MPRIVPLLLAGALCACGSKTPSGAGDGDGGTGGDDPAGPVPLSALCTAWGDAYCRAAVACGSVAATQVEACARVTASDCDLERAVAQVEDGRVVYDGAAYRRCLDRFAASPVCGEKQRPWLYETDPDCRAAAVGTREALEDCGATFGPFGVRECAHGECANPECGGSCRPALELGDACQWVCGPNLRCREGTCAPLGGVGEPCSRSGDECAAGLYCRNSHGDTGGTCTAPLAVGTACDFQEDLCESGAYCPSSQDGATCVPLDTEGEACDRFGESCGAGLACSDDEAPSCVAQHPLGGSCESDWDCLVPLSCDYASRRCVQRPIVGEPCTAPAGTPYACATGWCDGATCRRRVPNGESCTHDDGCGDKEAECVDGRCASYWCE